MTAFTIPFARCNRPRFPLSVLLAVCFLLGSRSVVRAVQGGPDQELGGFYEPTIAINFANPMNLAYSSAEAGNPAELRVSTDGGLSWEPPVQASSSSGHGCCGVPSVTFDSQGRLFWTYLAGVFDAKDNLIGLDIFVSQCEPATGTIHPGYPINVTEQLGAPAENGFLHDKQWIAADVYSGSPFQDRLYLAWTEFPASGTIIETTYSADQGLTWSPIQVLSDGAGEGFKWPVHNTVAPNGDVYVAYHSQPGFRSGAPDGVSGQVFLLRSTDGGVSYPQKTVPFQRGKADMTFNVQTTPAAIPGTQFWLQGSVQPWVLADPYRPGRMYVIANDDPDDDNTAGDHANVYIEASNDHGLTWERRRRVDGSGGNGIFQVMPTASIDPVSGFIVVHYYDNRAGVTNADGNYLLDVYTTYSMDGGRTFAPDFQINDLHFDPDVGAPERFPGPPPTLRIGGYNGVVVWGGVAGAVWCGNTHDIGGNPVDQQTIFDRYRIGPELTFNGIPRQGEKVNFSVTGAEPTSGTGLAWVLLSCSGAEIGIPLSDNLVLPLLFDACTLTSLNAAASFREVIDATGRADTPVLTVPFLPPGLEIFSAAFTLDLGTGEFVSVTPPIFFTTQ